MNKLLITGEMRSGTTLLANLLNAQEGMIVYRDFLLIDRLKRRVKVGWSEELSIAQKNRLIRYFNLDCCEVGKVTWNVDLDCFDTLISFYQHVLDNMAREETLVVGHKVTVAYASIPALLELVPDLHILFVSRDPRDVVVSALRRSDDEDAFKLVQRWRASFQMVHQLCEQERFQDRLLAIRYEDLLMDTTATLQKLSHFLQVPYIEIPSALHDYGEPWSGNSSFGELKKVLDPRPVGQWRSTDPEMGKRVEIILCKQIASAGYELSQEISLLDKAKCKTRYLLHSIVTRLHSAVTMLNRALMKVARVLANPH